MSGSTANLSIEAGHSPPRNDLLGDFIGEMVGSAFGPFVLGDGHCLRSVPLLMVVPFGAWSVVVDLLRRMEISNALAEMN
jgi:hypothetical protein